MEGLLEAVSGAAQATAAMNRMVATVYREKRIQVAGCLATHGGYPLRGVGLGACHSNRPMRSPSRGRE